MFPIEYIVQFYLEHRGDCMSERSTFDHNEIIGRDKPTFARADLAYSGRGIAYTMLYTKE